MIELHRVVIGVDFSEPSLAAARWAAREFAPEAELVLVHAVDVPEPPSFLRGRFPPRQTLLTTARDGADRRLRELSLGLGTRRIWLEVREGRAAEQLAAVAAEYGADVTVVGAHGQRTGLLKQLGSTAERVAREAAGPVLLAREPLGQPARLLVAMDEAGITTGQLEWTQMLAARHGAEVTGLHVVSETVLGTLVSLAAIASGTFDPEIPSLRIGEMDDARTWLQELIARGLDRARTHGEVAYGDPAHEIIAAAQRLPSDLIVMARHGSGGVRRALLGSVTDRVLRAAPCSVLVVTEPPGEASGRSEAVPLSAA